MTTAAVSCAKTAEPIELAFGMLSGVGLGNHVLNGGPDHSYEEAILRGKGMTHCIVQGLSTTSCSKTAVPIEMLIGM